MARVKRGLPPIGRETGAKKDLRRRYTFADIVEVVAQTRGEPWDSLIGRYADPGRWQALTLARDYTGTTLSELGQAVGGMDYAAIGMGISRFARRLQHDRKQRQALETMWRMLDGRVAQATTHCSAATCATTDPDVRDYRIRFLKEWIRHADILSTPASLTPLSGHCCPNGVSQA